MNLKDDADRIDILRKTVAVVKQLNHPFKIMIDRIGMNQIYQAHAVPEFIETQDHYYWDGIMMYRNDYVTGVWFELQ